MSRTKRVSLLAGLLMGLVVSLTPGGPVPLAWAGPALGTTFPPDFPVIVDASLGVPVIGFGAAGPVHRAPVIVLHGNNDTPFPTACNPALGKIHALAEFLLDQGYARQASCGGSATRATSATSSPTRRGDPETRIRRWPTCRT